MPRSIKITYKSGAITTVGGIPDDSKITFGPMAPGSRGSWNGEGHMTLRIWTGKDRDNQIAVFADVKEFVDLSLKCQSIPAPVKQTTAPKSKQSPFPS